MSDERATIEGFKDWFPLALRNIGAGEYAVFNKAGLRFIIIEGASIGEAVVNALNERINPPKCKWAEGLHGYNTSCGEFWSYTVGAADDLEMKFCPFDGKELEVDDA